MQDKRTDVLYGSLGLIILKTLEALGPLHGYRIARRIEQISGDHLALNQGTLYPALLKLEQAGWIQSSWINLTADARSRSTRSPSWAGSVWRRKKPPGSTPPASSPDYSRFRTRVRDQAAHPSGASSRSPGGDARRERELRAEIAVCCVAAFAARRATRIDPIATLRAE